MPRLLSTQSHVVHGYVGNKAATFPLQYLGWDVDCCNSVQFSNHTGYGRDRVFGHSATESELDNLLGGIYQNFGGDYDALLSGYLPNKEVVRCMGRHYAKFKGRNKGTIWLMDPVMGDEGTLYVSEDVIPEYRRLALSKESLVDIITPNQFELELLCGHKISSRDDLKKSLEFLHQTVPVIIVTSCAASLFEDTEKIYCVASMRGRKPIVYRVPFIDSYFTGVGDLFSALVVDRIYKLYTDVNEVRQFEYQINDILNIIQHVLKITRTLSRSSTKSKMGSVEGMKNAELRIIESREFFTHDSSMKTAEGSGPITNQENYVFEYL